MLSKTTKGIIAEHFVLKRLLENGFELADLDIKNVNLNFIGVDFILTKDNKEYRIQVKGFIDAKRCIIKQTNTGRNNKNYLTKVCDVVILTNIIDMWVVPYEYLKRKPSSAYMSLRKINCFKNNLDIITMNDRELMELLIDNKIHND